MLTFGSLCTGIGGMDLGLEQAGLTCRWQVEIDPWCRAVLAHHWPDVPRYEDVTTLEHRTLAPVDVVAAGYPCQPFSTAGKMLGTQDDRHLWPHVADAVRLLRPRFVLLENVPSHLGLGFDEVLADLAGLGFDAEWSVVPASAVGAPHRRPRLFVLAYSQEPKRFRRRWLSAVAAGPGNNEALAHPHRCRTHVSGPGDAEPWTTEPEVGRMADGLPGELVRAPLYALGNAVVPQAAEWIGRRLMEAA